MSNSIKYQQFLLVCLHACKKRHRKRLCGRAFMLVSWLIGLDTLAVSLFCIKNDLAVGV